MIITQEMVLDRLSYDPDTGIFVWRKAYRKKDIGRVSGWIHNAKIKPYLLLLLYGKSYPAHRIAWLYIHGYMPEFEIDHIDGDGLNNKLSNLREVTHAENCKNKRQSILNKSGCTGVSIHKETGKWRARIRDGKKYFSLGLFANIEDAITARKNAEIKHGYHPNHGSDRPLY